MEHERQQQEAEGTAAAAGEDASQRAIKPRITRITGPMQHLECCLK